MVALTARDAGRYGERPRCRGRTPLAGDRPVDNEHLSTLERLERLERLEQGTTAGELLTFFDSLPAVSVGQLAGSWQGSGIPTGHRLDGVLEAMGWHGKRFAGPEEAHPLLFDDGRGAVVPVNPTFAPMGLVLRAPGLARHPLTVRVFRLVLPLVRTRKPRARLRAMESRGVVTATMLYDALPINDAFRTVAPDTLLGLMDLRGMEDPFFFVLRRERGEADGAALRASARTFNGTTCCEPLDPRT